MSEIESNLNKWDYKGLTQPFKYGIPATYKLGMAHLVGCNRIEDWGCGGGGAKAYCPAGSSYVGVDGSVGPFTDVHADLTTYTSKADGIFMRHVLEHNYEWKKVLANALRSANKVVVINFLRWTSTEKRNKSATGIPLITLVRNAFMHVVYAHGFTVVVETEVKLSDDTPETVLVLEKNTYQPYVSKRGIIFNLWGANLHAKSECVRELSFSYPFAVRSGLGVRVVVAPEVRFDVTWIPGLTQNEVIYRTDEVVPDKGQWANRYIGNMLSPFEETLSLDTDSVVVDRNVFSFKTTAAKKWDGIPSGGLEWPFEVMKLNDACLAGAWALHSPLSITQNKEGVEQYASIHWADAIKKYDMNYFHLFMHGAVIYYTKQAYPLFEIARDMCIEHGWDDQIALAVAFHQLPEYKRIAIPRELYIHGIHTLETPMSWPAVILHIPHAIKLHFEAQDK